MRSINRTTMLALLFFGALCLLTLVVYWPGLSGSFLFDDYPNLEPLGAYGGVTNWHLLRLYLGDAIAGPTGRPIALLSFLLDANNWPASPYPFKYTNLLIHLLIGVVLFYLTLRLVEPLCEPERPAQPVWIAGLASGWWLLNAFNVSTTLYVVQRMAQLSALFVLLGVLGYVHGRRLLGRHPTAAYAWMTGSLIGCGLLALFSKENGALLPVFLLVIEYTVLRSTNWARPKPLWLAVFLWLPGLVLLVYLGWVGWWHSATAYATRPFTLDERLLSESRIVCDYLYHLFIPSAQTTGLFRDDYPLSTGLLSPPTTLLAVAGLAGLASLAIVLRRRAPTFSLAVGFFFAGHLIESTTVPLELYYEHRNYLPSIFLMLPLAWFGVRHYRRWKPWVLGISTIVLASQSVMTWQRATLWGDPPMLYLVWAREQPDSPRAQVAASTQLMKLGRTVQARRLLDEAARRMPDNLLLRLQTFAVRAQTGVVDEKTFQGLLALSRRASFDHQVTGAIAKLTELFSEARSDANYKAMQALIAALHANPAYGNRPEFAAFLDDMAGRLCLAYGRPEQAQAHFAVALRQTRNVDMGMMEMALLASAGHPHLALRHLDLTSEYLAPGMHGLLRLPRSEYLREIARLRGVLEKDEKAKAASHPTALR